MGKQGICTDCNATAEIKGRGLCRKHYNYRHHHGTLPEKPEKQKPVGVALTSGKNDETVVVRLGGPGPMLTIDFAQYPEIFEELKNRARDEMRPIEYQALFSIRAGLEAGAPDIKAVVDAIIREAKIESDTVRCA